MPIMDVLRKRIGSFPKKLRDHALVDFGCGRDVDTVIVDGKTLIQGGDVVHVDEVEVYANAQAGHAPFLKPAPCPGTGEAATLRRSCPRLFPSIALL